MFYDNPERQGLVTFFPRVEIQRHKITCPQTLSWREAALGWEWGLQACGHAAPPTSLSISVGGASGNLKESHCVPGR